MKCGRLVRPCVHALKGVENFRLQMQSRENADDKLARSSLRIFLSPCKTLQIPLTVNPDPLRWYQNVEGQAPLSYKYG